MFFLLNFDLDLYFGLGPLENDFLFLDLFSENDLLFADFFLFFLNLLFFAGFAAAPTAFLAISEWNL